MLEQVIKWQTDRNLDKMPYYHGDECKNIIEEVSCKEKLDNSLNNGGKTDYYDLPKDAKCCQDIIEWREMNFQQGNIFKVAFTFNCGRHSGTDYRRDLNKIIYFAQRELERLTNENPRT